MRYPASEKLEIIRTVEASHLPVKRTLARLGIPSSTVRRQSFPERGGAFVTEALARFLFQFRRQQIGAASGVCGLSAA